MLMGDSFFLLPSNYLDSVGFMLPSNYLDSVFACLETAVMFPSSVTAHSHMNENSDFIC